MLVEPACGAALAAVYSGLVKQLGPHLPPGDIGEHNILENIFFVVGKFLTLTLAWISYPVELILGKLAAYIVLYLFIGIVVVVCGGNAVNLDLIFQWKKEMEKSE